MALCGCVVTPHPPIIVPEVGRGRLAEVASTVDAMRRLGEEARAMAPDVVVVMSPHAQIDPRRMGVSTAQRHVGSLAYFGVPEVRLDLAGAVGLAESIMAEAAVRGVPAAPLPFRDGVFELDHGCLVPLAFLVPPLSVPPSVVVLSFSYLSTEQHEMFGRAIGHAIDAYDGRVLYVASGDMSHRLTPDAPAGYTPRGAEFDHRVIDAFAAADAHGLLNVPEGLIHQAGECGYRSLVTLFGLLRGRTYRTRVLSYEGPFGVGYLVGAVDLETAGVAPSDAVGGEAR